MPTDRHWGLYYKIIKWLLEVQAGSESEGVENVGYLTPRPLLVTRVNLHNTNHHLLRYWRYLRLGTSLQHQFPSPG